MFGIGAKLWGRRRKALIYRWSSAAAVILLAIATLSSLITGRPESADAAVGDYSYAGATILPTGLTFQDTNGSTMAQATLTRSVTMPDGTIWVLGSWKEKSQSKFGLIHIDSTGTRLDLSELPSGLTMPVSIAPLPDGSLAGIDPQSTLHIYNDQGQGTATYDTSQTGLPDAMSSQTVYQLASDTQGNIYAYMLGGASIYQLNAAGQLSQTVTATCANNGGAVHGLSATPDGQTAYIICYNNGSTVGNTSDDSFNAVVKADLSVNPTNDTAILTASDPTMATPAPNNMIAVDSDSGVYVAAGSRDGTGTVQLWHYASNGSLIAHYVDTAASGSYYSLLAINAMPNGSLMAFYTDLYKNYDSNLNVTDYNEDSGNVYHPDSFIRDAAGNFYVSDEYNTDDLHSVRKYNAAGEFQGNIAFTFPVDFSVAATQPEYVDASGNFYAGLSVSNSEQTVQGAEVQYFKADQVCLLVKWNSNGGAPVNDCLVSLPAHFHAGSSLNGYDFHYLSSADKVVLTETYYDDADMTPGVSNPPKHLAVYEYDFKTGNLTQINLTGMPKDYNGNDYSPVVDMVDAQGRMLFVENARDDQGNQIFGTSLIKQLNLDGTTETYVDLRDLTLPDGTKFCDSYDGYGCTSIDDLQSDAAGNLYLSGTFIVADGTTTQIQTQAAADDPVTYSVIKLNTSGQISHLIAQSGNDNESQLVQPNLGGVTRQHWQTDNEGNVYVLDACRSGWNYCIKKYAIELPPSLSPTPTPPLVPTPPNTGAGRG
jgi:hypothetical protein